MRALILGMLLGGVVTAMGCSKDAVDSGTTAASYDGAIASDDVSTGAMVYATFCDGCHPGGAKGDGPAISGLELSPAAMRKQIREGGDDMPDFGTGKINGDQLEALLAHLATLGAVK